MKWIGRLLRDAADRLHCRRTYSVNGTTIKTITEMPSSGNITTVMMPKSHSINISSTVIGAKRQIAWAIRPTCIAKGTKFCVHVWMHTIKTESAEVLLKCTNNATHK